MLQFQARVEISLFPKASSSTQEAFKSSPSIDNDMSRRPNVWAEECTSSSNHKCMRYFHRGRVFCAKFGLQRLLQWT
jgi:hypothetical protein